MLAGFSLDRGCSEPSPERRSTENGGIVLQTSLRPTQGEGLLPRGRGAVLGARWARGGLQAASEVVQVGAGCVVVCTCERTRGLVLLAPGRGGGSQPPRGHGWAHVTVSVPCTPATLISCAELLAGTRRSHRVRADHRALPKSSGICSPAPPLPRSAAGAAAAGAETRPSSRPASLAFPAHFPEVSHPLPAAGLLSCPSHLLLPPGSFFGAGEQP